jgi:hypothetical protein
MLAAQAWLDSIDGGLYDRSWHEASEYFRGAIGQAQWTLTLEGHRKPLGRLLSRGLRSAQPTSTLPGAPDGRYVVMQFDSAFEHKRTAIETVTVVQDRDGRWRAAGYFIR